MDLEAERLKNDQMRQEKGLDTVNISDLRNSQKKRQKEKVIQYVREQKTKQLRRSASSYLIIVELCCYQVSFTYFNKMLCLHFSETLYVVSRSLFSKLLKDAKNCSYSRRV